MRLSVLVPCYNERKTVAVILDRVARVDLSAIGLTQEIVFVDDGSTDGSADEARAFAAAHPEVAIAIVSLAKNHGKGFAIREGLRRAKGDFVIVQDADLEYFPEDWRELLAPLAAGEADVVYGSRKMGPSGPYPERAIFDLALAIENVAVFALYGFPITDVCTCYKAFRTDILRSLDLRCVRFEFCPEVTCRLLARGVTIVERPIRYLPRGRRDGKKIKARDFFEAIFEIVRCRLRFGERREFTARRARGELTS
ncbi:glycosyltransferase family 2 protein [bacterium]|nr:glycosyltransferase family 2 protein [bacterium]